MRSANLDEYDSASKQEQCVAEQRGFEPMAIEGAVRSAEAKLGLCSPPRAAALSCCQRKSAVGLQRLKFQAAVTAVSK
jgi:hypothetical protein